MIVKSIMTSWSIAVTPCGISILTCDVLFGGTEELNSFQTTILRYLYALDCQIHWFFYLTSWTLCWQDENNKNQQDRRYDAPPSVIEEIQWQCQHWGQGQVNLWWCFHEGIKEIKEFKSQQRQDAVGLFRIQTAGNFLLGSSKTREMEIKQLLKIVILKKSTMHLVQCQYI